MIVVDFLQVRFGMPVVVRTTVSYFVSVNALLCGIVRCSGSV